MSTKEQETIDEIQEKAERAEQSLAKLFEELGHAGPEHIGPLSPSEVSSVIQSANAEQVAAVLTSPGVIDGIHSIVRADIAHSYSLTVLGQFAIAAMSAQQDVFEAILATIRPDDIMPVSIVTKHKGINPLKSSDGEVEFEKTDFNPANHRLAYALYGPDLYAEQTSNRQSKAVKRLQNALDACKAVQREADMLHQEELQANWAAENPLISGEDKPQVEEERQVEAKPKPPSTARASYKKLYMTVRVYSENAETGERTMDQKATLRNRDILNSWFLAAGFPMETLVKWRDEALNGK